MRIDTKLNALMLVTQPGEFTLDSESILGDQRVKINNWKDVCIALRVLQEVNWLPDDQHNRLLVDYLENRGDLEVIELSPQEFQMLEQAVQRYNGGLPIVINTLKAHARAMSSDTIWIELRSVSDPAELSSITAEIERALNIAGQAGASFRFAGVAQGSDWLGFIPGSPLVGIALNYCISLAATVTVELLKVTGPIINAVAKLTLDDDNQDREPTQEEINERIKAIKDRATDEIIDEAVRAFIERLDNTEYPPEVRNQVGVAIRATTKIVRELGESNRAVFEMSESGKNIVVQVHGDNNQITVQNFPELPNPREALAPGDSE